MSVLEPYNIIIIDLEKDDCSYVNDVIRVGKNAYFRLASKSGKLDKGYFLGFACVPVSLTLMHREIYFESITSHGTFVRAGSILFLEEELVNYYA